MMTDDKANPKGAAGRAKIPLHLWPASATAAGSLGFLEGELKYGRNNYRATDVAASVYVAAAKRHIDAWFEGQEVSPDYKVPHLGNALACLAILVDAQANGSLIDDRNFTKREDGYAELVAELTQVVVFLKAQLGDRTPHHWDRRDQVQQMQGVQEEFAFGEPKATDPKIGKATEDARNMANGLPKDNPEDCACLACQIAAAIDAQRKQPNSVRTITLSDLLNGKF